MTIEDEELPKLGDRLPQALEVARCISRYGGSMVVLIHPNILGHKLAFEKGFVEAVRPYAWFGSIGEFGRWWSARNQVEVDVVREATVMRVTLTVPQPVAGLTVEVPEGWRLMLSPSSPKGIEQGGTVITFPELQGTQKIQFTSSVTSKVSHLPSIQAAPRRS